MNFAIYRIKKLRKSAEFLGGLTAYIASNSDSDVINLRPDILKCKFSSSGATYTQFLSFNVTLYYFGTLVLTKSYFSCFSQMFRNKSLKHKVI